MLGKVQLVEFANGFLERTLVFLGRITCSGEKTGSADFVSLQRHTGSAEELEMHLYVR